MLVLSLLLLIHEYLLRKWRTRWPARNRRRRYKRERFENRIPSRTSNASRARSPRYHIRVCTVAITITRVHQPRSCECERLLVLQVMILLFPQRRSSWAHKLRTRHSANTAGRTVHPNKHRTADIRSNNTSGLCRFAKRAPICR